MSRPRIHWVSPLPPAETDIAAYTARILPALAARAEVVLWTDAEAWEPALEAHATVRRYDAGAHFPMPLEGLAPQAEGAEAAFFHIGNSWIFHAGPLNLARRVPGVVVLHDLALQDLMRGLIENRHFDAAIYRAEMERWYGPRGAETADAILADRLRPADAAARMPFFEVAFRCATAVLTHTEPGFARLSARRALPVYALDLPYAPGPERPAARAADGPLRLVQFGYLAPNRRLDQVLEALALVRDRLAFELDVFGTLWDEPHVRAKIGELGLADRVRLRGFAPEAELDAALAAAHLVFNLRSPSMGEASGSQLRIWNAGAASVVSDTGWYATLPEDCVAKVPAHGEVEPLARLIEAIDRDRARAAALGAAGRARLMRLHTPERYADGIVEAAERQREDARDALFVDAARRLLAGCPRPRLPSARLAALLGEPR